MFNLLRVQMEQRPTSAFRLRGQGDDVDVFQITPSNVLKSTVRYQMEIEQIALPPMHSHLFVAITPDGIALKINRVRLFIAPPIVSP